MPKHKILQKMISKQIKIGRYELRPYQAKAVSDVLSQLRLGNATLLVSPTGAGKTVIAAKIAEKFDHVLVVAHRRELLDQASEKMNRYVSIHSIQSVLKYGPSATQLSLE